MKKTGQTAVGSASWVESIVRRFWAKSPENTMNNGTGEKAWGEPLIGTARADDPLFDQIKADIGDFLWTPAEAFALAHPGSDVPPSQLTVISWVLPQTAATRADQGTETLLPAERWARSRDFGEKFNCALRLHLADALTEVGFPAVAPERLPGFDYRRSEKFGIASNWSERHTAFVAGLGTFGLSDGLITEKGKAVRIGSVVARIDLPVAPRPYGNDHQAWCLWYAKGSCGVCIRRCPKGAIDKDGHDKQACFDYIRKTTAPFAQKSFGVEATPCGLCQVKIPCEGCSPV